MTRQSLAVNPIACDGHGICAELLPELIQLDDWGYPIIDPNPVPAHLEALARRAVAACPMLALRLRKLEAAAGGGPGLGGGGGGAVAGPPRRGS